MLSHPSLAVIWLNNNLFSVFSYHKYKPMCVCVGLCLCLLHIQQVYNIQFIYVFIEKEKRIYENIAFIDDSETVKINSKDNGKHIHKSTYLCQCI